jgi:hypothetical protein
MTESEDGMETPEVRKTSRACKVFCVNGEEEVYWKDTIYTKYFTGSELRNKKGAMQSFCFARYHPYRFL